MEPVVSGSTAGAAGVGVGVGAVVEVFGAVAGPVEIRIWPAGTM